MIFIMSLTKKRLDDKIKDMKLKTYIKLLAVGDPIILVATSDNNRLCQGNVSDITEKTMIVSTGSQKATFNLADGALMHSVSIGTVNQTKSFKIHIDLPDECFATLKERERTKEDSDVFNYYEENEEDVDPTHGRYVPKNTNTQNYQNYQSNRSHRYDQYGNVIYYGTYDHFSENSRKYYVGETIKDKKSSVEFVCISNKDAKIDSLDIITKHIPPVVAEVKKQDFKSSTAKAEKDGSEQGTSKSTSGDGLFKDDVLSVLYDYIKEEESKSGKILFDPAEVELKL